MASQQTQPTLSPSSTPTMSRQERKSADPIITKNNVSVPILGSDVGGDEPPRVQLKVQRNPISERAATVPRIMLNIVDRNDDATSIGNSKSPTDLGIPAVSLPNLSIETDSSDDPYDDKMERTGSRDDSDHALRLYCSPRMSRRSMNLDLNLRESPNDTGYCWLSTFGTSNYLREGSRVGSAISLNSDCTARSIGLISNDSSDTTSYMERLGELGGLMTQRSNMLRRHLSNPEHSQELPTCMRRNSRSWSNLKDGQPDSLPEAEMERSMEGEVTDSEKADFTDASNSPHRTLPLPPSCRIDETTLPIPPQPRRSFEEVYDTGCRSPLVRSRVGSKALQEGRIKQWLQQISKSEEQNEIDFDGQDYYS
ncbi:uncharacterized protein LOC106873622 [Octopus bimaculoides]|uniref:Uncharacterized protein n=1 Tax=Octopus bimaculoides TaxID=37653 RepID=A0A0L8H036_OCTBM|nr:uncharacterized protein LOC106873622 [Octopus bimaculoides]|eukprot:XP_014776553.1 PREDICTED: uncharacterized protein LOC106873622 [Octopus bimaculoides]